MHDDMLGGDEAAAVVWRYADAVAAHRDALTELDTAVGDGDHGTNLDRGLRAAVQALDAATPDTPGAVFNLVGRRLVSTVGGASGALYGTAMLRAAASSGGAERLDAGALAAVLRAAADGIAARGKCVAGDKTMYDVWQAAVTAAETALADGAPTAGMLAAAATAADEQAAAMTPWQARRGRASYLGERSIGRPDPGAESSRLWFACLAAAAGE